MQVLSENRQILSLVGLGTDNDVQVFSKLIPKKFVATAFGLALFSGVLIACLLIRAEYSNGPAALLFPVGFLLSFLSQLFSYLSLLVKRSQMCELFDYLQHSIETSNVHRESTQAKLNQFYPQFVHISKESVLRLNRR